MRTWLKIAASVLSLVIALFALDKIYSFGLRHNLNIKLTSATISPVNADVIYHGPCEPLWMMSPAALDSVAGSKSYNLALSNSDFADNYLHLYLYLKNNKPPEYIFLYVTPASFHAGINTFNSFRFAPYLDDIQVAWVVRDNDPDYYRFTFIPFIRYAYYNSEITYDVLQGYKHWFTVRKTAFYPDGFEPPALNAVGVRDGKFVQKLADSVIYKWDPLREKYLRKIIRLGKAKGSEVILYESPMLAEATDKEVQRTEFLSRIHQIAREEGSRFILFDSIPFATDRACFNAPRNFNRRGVKMWTDTFSKYLKSTFRPEP